MFQIYHHVSRHNTSLKTYRRRKVLVLCCARTIVINRTSCFSIWRNGLLWQSPQILRGCGHGFTAGSNSSSSNTYCARWILGFSGYHISHHWANSLELLVNDNQVSLAQPFSSLVADRQTTRHTTPLGPRKRCPSRYLPAGFFSGSH